MDDEKKKVEEWAAAKGMLPQIFPGEERGLPGGMVGDKLGSRSVQIGKLRGPRANPNFWKFAAAKAGEQWPDGQEVTEYEFDDAVTLATVGHQMR